MTAYSTISALLAASSLTGAELLEVSQLSSTVTISAGTISAAASDNSFNDSANGFVTAGFAVGDRVKVAGFTGNVANNIFTGSITALTAGKMTIGGTDGDVIVDDAAGETVTISKWITRRTTSQEVADLAKPYVDAQLAKVASRKVRVASTAAITLATGCENGDTIDGVTLATGDRVLLKNQSSGAENGIWVVAASGSPTRATDADSSAELVNVSIWVAEGTSNADTLWTCTTNAPITVGTTSLTFSQFVAGGYSDENARDAIGAALVAGANITITVNDAGDTITIAASGGGSTVYPVPKVSQWTLSDASAGATQTDGSTSGNNARAIRLSVPVNTGSAKAAVMYRTAPSTPYRIVARFKPGFREFVLNAYHSMGIGFYDPATGKAQILGIVTAQSGGANTYLVVMNWNSKTSFNAFAAQKDRYISSFSDYYYSIYDDGTTVYFQISETGHPNDWQTFYSVAKSSGFLGSSGYGNPCIFVDCNGSAATTAAAINLTLWDENGLSRTVDDIALIP